MLLFINYNTSRIGNKMRMYILIENQISVKLVEMRD